MRRIAPNLVDELNIFRAVLADPPMCSYADLVLPGRLTIDDVLDMNELLDLRQAIMDKVRDK